MTTRQGALTIITRIAQDCEKNLRSLLNGIGDNVEQSDLVPFTKTTTMHFARWVLLPECTSVIDDTIFPAQLVLSTSYDEPLDVHIEELVRLAPRGLDAIYEHCEGYPTGKNRTPATVVAYLLDHTVDNSILYVGAPGISVEQVHRESRLRRDIENFLDDRHRETNGWAGCTADAIRNSVQEYVAGKPKLKWAIEPLGPPVRSLPWYGWLALGLTALLFLPILLLGFCLIRTREIGDERREARLPELPAHEERAPAETSPPSKSEIEENTRAVTVREDHQVQNQLSHVVEIKPGWIRRLTLAALLPMLYFGARRIYNQGSLFGVSTLHFVRWVKIDRGRRLMFLTNYDGSMIRYVADFVNKSWEIPSALTAIWSNTLGFPRSRWLIFAGARDAPRFTAFLREHQVETQVWYSAYKGDTTGNIINNARIRRGLVGDLHEESTQEWLRRF